NDALRQLPVRKGALRMRARVIPALAGVAAMIAGCTGADSAANAPSGMHFRPFFRQVQCPADVAVQLVVRHRCGYLTVLQNRSEPAGKRVKVFVVTIIPPGRPRADPMLSFGFDLGFSAEFGSNAPLAARVGRITYLMDPRGTGHSTPSLACPETNQLTSASLR